MKRRIDNGKGFNLIEVLVALAILSLGILTVIQMQAMAINSLTVSRHQSVATQLAQRQLEFIRSLPYNPVDASGCSIVDGHPLVDPNGHCYLFDDTAGDANWGPYIYPGFPRNDLGDQVAADHGGIKFYVRWRVQQGGPSGTPAGTGNTGMPGPGQLLIQAEAIWWEEMPGALPNLWGVSSDQIRHSTPRGHVVTLTALRQEDF